VLMPIIPDSMPSAMRQAGREVRRPRGARLVGEALALDGGAQSTTEVRLVDVDGCDDVLRSATQPRGERRGVGFRDDGADRRTRGCGDGGAPRSGVVGLCIEHDGVEGACGEQRGGVGQRCTDGEAIGSERRSAEGRIEPIGAQAREQDIEGGLHVGVG